MKAPPFVYHAPETIGEALARLAEVGGDAAVLAGGQSLVPMLALRIARPSHVVDVNRVSQLSEITTVDGTLRLGAMVRQQHAMRSALVRERSPLLAEAVPHVGHRETRSRGTVGGSVAHADPAAEIPTVSVALDARVVLRSSRRTRSLPVEEFLQGPFMTLREPDELLVALEVPPAPPGGWSYERIARRRHDIALVGVAAGVAVGDDGNIADLRLAFAGMDATAIRTRSAERLVIGAPPSAEAFRAAVDDAVSQLQPGSDVLASRAYRAHVARVLAERALQRALERARTGRE